MPVELQSVIDALEKVKKASEGSGFKESVDLVVTLVDFDLKKPENRINEVVELPNPIPKNVKVCIFASGDLALRAQRAGADRVLDREGMERVAGDKKEAKNLVKSYDFFFAEAPLMPSVGRTLGTYLGPRGKMPTPIPPSAPVEPILQRSRRSVRVRVKDQPNIMCRVGTVEMDTKMLAENVQAVMNRVEGRLEKGLRNVKSLSLKSTMSTPIRINLTR